MIRNPLYVYGPPAVDVPADLNFGEFFINKIWGFKERTALINSHTSEKITFGDMAQQAMNLAISLTHIGVKKGDVIAICSENRMEYFPAVLGCACTGAAVTTVNPTYTTSELKHVMSISKPKYLICSPYFYNYKVKLLKSLPLKKIILFGDENRSNVIYYNDIAIVKGNHDSKTLFANNKLLRNVKKEEFISVDVEGQNDVLFILYSSGTTGLPKGVMQTHLNVITSCCLPSSLDPEKLGLVFTPWFHTMGLLGCLYALNHKRTLVFLSKFEINHYLETIEKYKLEQITVVPPILVAVCKSTANYDLNSVKVVYSGAAPLQGDIMTLVKNKFPNVQYVMQGYGMTEVTLAVIRHTFDNIDKFQPGSIGSAVNGVTVKVVDIDTRKPLGPHQRGELCFKGGLVMKGYIGKEAKDDFDDEGFFKTGDIGYYDENQQFFIVDRLKELIKYKAFQVAPAEIEALLLQHEAVRDAGVVGVPDKAAGELPLAFVVKQPGSNVTEKELQDFVAEHLSNPKHLRGGVRFVNDIPKNPSGKILRNALKAMISKKKAKL